MGRLLAGKSGGEKAAPKKLAAAEGSSGLDKSGCRCHIVNTSWQLASKIVRKKASYPPGFAESAAAEAHPVGARVEPETLGDLSRHGYTEDEIFALVVPKRTLARRKAAHEPLTIEETDKALRLERIAVQAERVFGDADKAHRWLRKAKRELRGETPLAYLASETGARVVEEMLFRIEHGIFN